MCLAAAGAGPGQLVNTCPDEYIGIPLQFAQRVEMLPWEVQLYNPFFRRFPRFGE